MSVAVYEPSAQSRAWTTLLPVAAELAAQIAGTDFVPVSMRNNPAMVAAAILYGDEIGVGPMQSLARISVINGRPTLAAEMQRALILRAGHDLWIEESTTTKCTVAGRRKDSDATSRITWTIDDAKRAGIAGKQPWRQYPRQMLLARASAELARAVFPDAIGGLAATEELDEEDAAGNAPANGGQPTDEPKKTSKRRRANVTAGPVTTPDQPAPPKPPPPPVPGDEPGFDRPDPAQFMPPNLPDIDDGTIPLMDDSQRRNMMRLFNLKGIDDRHERLSYSSSVIGRPINTANELNRDEADQIVNWLEQYDPNDPSTWAPIDRF